jgi:integrase
VHRLDDPKKPLSNRTVQKDRTMLYRLFEIAEKLEYRDGNPVARTEAPKVDPRTPVILTPDENERLLAQCDGRPMLRLYVLVLGESGVRCESEALRLRWEDVDLAEGFLWIASGRDGHRTKSGKGRWVPLTPRLTAALRAHLAAYRLAGSPWVFHHERARRTARAGDRITKFRGSFLAAARRAKLPTALRQHDLRHRRVTTWLADGKNPVHVKEAMGHADLKTTMAYTHLAREHLRALTDVQAAALPAPAQERAQLKELA